MACMTLAPNSSNVACIKPGKWSEERGAFLRLVDSATFIQRQAY